MTSRAHRPHTASPSITKQNRSVSAHHRGEISARTDDERLRNSTSDDSLQQYYSSISETYRRPTLGLQHRHVNEPASRLLRQSGIYRHPALTPGQKLYLLDKCHVYDSEESKRHRTNSYLQLLTKRFNEDSLYKPEYRLTDPREYLSYAKFIATPRPTARAVNTGYLTPRTSRSPRIPNVHKKQHSTSRLKNHLDRKDFGVISDSSPAHHNVGKENTSYSSRCRSGSSSQANIDHTSVAYHQQKPKEIPKISVKLS